MSDILEKVLIIKKLKFKIIITLLLPEIQAYNNQDINKIVK
jgi:hypothetical protein